MFLEKILIVICFRISRNVYAVSISFKFVVYTFFLLRVFAFSQLLVDLIFVFYGPRDVMSHSWF